MSAAGQKIEIGRVVERGFAALGRQIGSYLAFALLLSGLPSALLAWLALSQSGTFSMSMPGYWALTAFTTIAGLILQATITRSALRGFQGLSPRIGSSFVDAFGFLLPMIGILIVTGILSGIGFILLVVPGVIVFIMLIVSIPVLVGEECGMLQAIKRSRRLTKGSRGRIFLLLILFAIVYLVAAGAISALSTTLIGDSAIGAALGQGVIATGSSLLSCTMLAALYFELRTAKEGAAVEGLAEVFA